MELRRQRRAQACRRIAVQQRYWCHAALCAWAARCSARQQEEILVQNLSVATSQMDAAQAQAEVAWTEADRYREAAGRWEQRCTALSERLALRRSAGSALAAWRLLAA